MAAETAYKVVGVKCVRLKSGRTIRRNQVLKKGSHALRDLVEELEEEGVKARVALTPDEVTSKKFLLKIEVEAPAPAPQEATKEAKKPAVVKE